MILRSEWTWDDVRTRIGERLVRTDGSPGEYRLTIMNLGIPSSIIPAVFDPEGSPILVADGTYDETFRRALSSFAPLDVVRPFSESREAPVEDQRVDLVVIAAMDEIMTIGREGKVPWNHRGDSRRFLRRTRGKAVIVGRKTLDGLGEISRNWRKYFVVSSSPPPRGASWCKTMSEAVDRARRYSVENGLGEVFVAGGTRIFREALPMADRMELTTVHEMTPGGDAFFPRFDPGLWTLSSVTSLPDTASGDEERPPTLRVFVRGENQ